MYVTPFQQELIKVGVQALSVAVAGGLSVVVGWVLLRGQERIRREEELWAGMRKLRAEALVKGVEAVGRLFSVKASLIMAEESGKASPERIEKLRVEEVKALSLVVDATAYQQFLLGQLAVFLSDSAVAVNKATSSKEVSDAIEGLHLVLGALIPPLVPSSKGRRWLMKQISKREYSNSLP